MLSLQTFKETNVMDCTTSRNSVFPDKKIIEQVSKSKVQIPLWLQLNSLKLKTTGLVFQSQSWNLSTADGQKPAKEEI